MKEQIITEERKTCSKCKELKPLSEFYVNRTTKDGYNNYCKDCCKKYYKDRQSEKGKKVKKRVCPKCGQEKSLSKFGKDASRADGVQPWCKECTNKKMRVWRMGEVTEGPSNMYKKGFYEKNKALILASSLKSYYTTAYVEKKYLKRYRASLEKVMEKRDDLLRIKEEQGTLLHYQQEKLDGYLAAIERWKEKITEMEDLIATYESDRKKAEAPSEEKKQEKQEPNISNDMEEQKTETPKEKNAMTKKDLIRLLAGVPDNAQIIYVGEVGNKSSLVAVWHPDHDSVCIRNLTRKMPYIFTKGALFDLASGAVPTEYDAKNMDSIEEE